MARAYGVELLNVMALKNPKGDDLDDIEYDNGVSTSCHEFACKRKDVFRAVPVVGTTTKLPPLGGLFTTILTDVTDELVDSKGLLKAAVKDNV